MFLAIDVAARKILFPLDACPLARGEDAAGTPGALLITSDTGLLGFEPPNFTSVQVTFAKPRADSQLLFALTFINDPIILKRVQGFSILTPRSRIKK
jgi:hypothetical protein